MGKDLDFCLYEVTDVGSEAERAEIARLVGACMESSAETLRRPGALAGKTDHAYKSVTFPLRLRRLVWWRQGKAPHSLP
eukprot:12911040-Prorocentrum_lima.AAC.1